jgi:NAD(P)-dependent dehydrogenase (short-subunit alcohol dehydrogenase family)
VDLSREGLRESLAAVEKAGGTGLTVEADVTRSADVTRYAAAVAERFGGIDCFFNNLPVQRRRRLHHRRHLSNGRRLDGVAPSMA